MVIYVKTVMDFVLHVIVEAKMIVNLVLMDISYKLFHKEIVLENVL